MSRCAAFDSSCVRANEVIPWITVASNTISTSLYSPSGWCLLMTSSIRNLVEAGSTNPETRLTTISARPAINNPRRGRISSQTSGSTARSLWTFGGFEVSLGGELNLLFDASGPSCASLLEQYHTLSCCDSSGSALYARGVSRQSA